MRAGDVDAALAALEDWIAANPDDRATQRDLAGAYLKARRYEPAIEHHLRLLEADSDDPVILRNLARAYGEVGDPRALSYAEKAYTIAPQSVQALDTLGWILVRRRQTARGLDLLAKARGQAPREPVIGYHVAAALAALGRRDEARLALKNILESGTAFDAADEARALLRKLSGD
jgi:predicted Zn-dependent protease